jgi:hypothetical protein
MHRSQFCCERLAKMDMGSWVAGVLHAMSRRPPLQEGSAWTGPWTGTQRTPSAACAFMAPTQGIVAGQARAADERASHNLPVAGSSPARPTCAAPPAAPTCGFKVFAAEACKVCAGRPCPFRNQMSAPGPGPKPVPNRRRRPDEREYLLRATPISILRHDDVLLAGEDRLGLRCTRAGASRTGSASPRPEAGRR